MTARHRRKLKRKLSEDKGNLPNHIDMTTNPTTEVPTWDQLIESVSDGAKHPEETNWAIYRYLRQNYKSIGSKEARMLLATYMKLRQKKPSLINSCMLAIAVKVSEEYADFHFPNFLKAWGYDSCLRNEDRQRQTGKDGRQYPALIERTERALNSCLLHHPEESREGCHSIVMMYAATMFEKEQNGHKRRFVKLVAPDGTEFIADSHQFPCRPYEICGRMFDVLTRVSKQGSERAAEIVLSKKTVQEAFATTTGYVDGIDTSRGHIHVYDSMSRHFVAEKSQCPEKAAVKGSFVTFCPIIAQGDHFKSAAITALLDTYKGREAFGIHTARIMYVNAQECYIRYSITSGSTAADGGTIAQEGFASTARMPEEAKRQLAVGQPIRLTLFLKRGKDGVKRNYVAEVF